MKKSRVRRVVAGLVTAGVAAALFVAAPTVVAAADPVPDDAGDVRVTGPVTVPVMWWTAQDVACDVTFDTVVGVSSIVTAGATMFPAAAEEVRPGADLVVRGVSARVAADTFSATSRSRAERDAVDRERPQRVGQDVILEGVGAAQVLPLGVLRSMCVSGLLPRFADDVLAVNPVLYRSVDLRAVELTATYRPGS